MIIIWGRKGRWSVKKDQGGQFFCPRCGGDRNWVLAALRYWFTLFWIPLFPMGKTVAEAVQCETCNSRFEPSVLQQPTANELSTQLQGSMRLGVAAVVRAGGGTGGPTAVEAVQRTGFAGYDDAALAHDVGELDVNGLDQHLAYLADALTLPGKEQFLGSLVHVAQADGTLDAARPIVDRIGAGLGLSPAHVTGIIASPPLVGEAPAAQVPSAPDALALPPPPAPDTRPTDHGSDD